MYKLPVICHLRSSALRAPQAGTGWFVRSIYRTMESNYHDLEIERNLEIDRASEF